MANILFFLISISAFAVALTVHEYSHGRVAYALGDRTAREAGRLTLNPLAHIDPVGTVLLPIVLALMKLPPFGWAKPVPVNFYNLRNPRRDMVLVGLAGPGANFVMAILAAVLLKLKFIPALDILQIFLVILVLVNLILGIFNLVPIPPLDGSRVLTGLLPLKYAMAYSRMEPFGFIILLAMLWFGLINKVVVPLVNFVANLLGVNWPL